jgi:hypothetical protein
MAVKKQGDASTVPEFTRVRRAPKRAVYERNTLHHILDVATHCHVAHVIDGRPVATPTLHWRIGEHVYWHGSVASRMLKATAVRSEVCLTVTVMDGWVLARSAFNHSANYRSVMCFGTPVEIVEREEKIAVIRTLTERLFPGRWDRLRPLSSKEINATCVLSLPLTAASAKVRVGPPNDPPRDRAWPVWAGVIPIEERLRRPVADAFSPPHARAPRLPTAARRRG